MKEKKQRKPWSRKTWKILAIVLASILGFEVLLVGGFTGYYSISDYLFYRNYENTGESDRLSSWNINQDLSVRAPEWKQIVQNSSFQLGELQVNYGLEDWWTIRAFPDATYPTIDGSTVMVAMAVEFARQHLNLTDEETLRLSDFSTTSAAYANLFRRFDQAQYAIIIGTEYERAMSGRPLDLFLGTAPGEQELALAERNGVIPVMKPICWDGFVFITHKDNPVESLTLEQLRGIYSGAIANWKEVGGEDIPIAAYQREKGSGSQTGMEELVMQGVPLDQAPKVEHYNSMVGLVEAVAEYRNDSASIGYTYKYYIENLYKNPDIKMLRINGVAPTDENIVSGAYPLSVNYYGVIRAGDEEAPGGLFLDWILSEEGQACVKQAGYIPISN